MTHFDVTLARCFCQRGLAPKTSLGEAIGKDALAAQLQAVNPLLAPLENLLGLALRLLCQESYAQISKLHVSLRTRTLQHSSDVRNPLDASPHLGSDTTNGGNCPPHFGLPLSVSCSKALPKEPYAPYCLSKFTSCCFAMFPPESRASWEHGCFRHPLASVASITLNHILRNDNHGVLNHPRHHWMITPSPDSSPGLKHLVASHGPVPLKPARPALLPRALGSLNTQVLKDHGASQRLPTSSRTFRRSGCWLSPPHLSITACSP